jgi:hypothetical protein
MKKTLLTILFLIFSIIIFAKPVNEEKAKEVAFNFLRKNTNSTVLNQAKFLNLTYSINATVNNNINVQTILYVFNIDNTGFIIISGDDIVFPVLGYSDESIFVSENLHSNIKKWLENYKNEILFAIENKIKATDEINKAWSLVDINKKQTNNSTFTTNAVNPLIQTEWNQAPYYNALSPGGSVTGCVATAMAQIMKFWNYPATGNGFHLYNHAQYGTLSANFGNTTYQWNLMPNSVLSPNNAVATLMYHCGVSVDMNYSPQSSNAAGAIKVSPALNNYFGYQNTSVSERANFTDLNWINLLKTELDQGRPMYYEGTGGGSGHAFVCDGYNNNFFHFNWGWGGQQDGYFQINSLNPGSLGIGGGTGGYNSNQKIVKGIQPPATAINYNLALYSNVTPSASSIGYGNPFTVSTNIANYGTSNFTGDYTIAAFDNSGVFVDYIETKTNFSLQSQNAYTNNLVFSTSGLFSLLPGTYTLGLFYRPTGGNWKVVQNNGSYTNFPQITIINSNPLKLNSVISVSPSITLTQGQSASINLNVVNNGSTTFFGQYKVAMYKLDGTWVQDISTLNEVNGLPVGYTYSSPYLTFNTSSINVVPGSYLVALQHKNSSGNWELTGSTSTFINPIRVTVIEAPYLADIYENNDTFNQAYNLPLSFANNIANVNTIGSNAHIGNDFDYYKIILPSGYNYTITPRIHDGYNSGNGNTYTLDALFSYSTDGVNWSSAYDDITPSNIAINNGGTIYFHCAPYFQGEKGTYMLDVNLTRTISLNIEENEIAKNIKSYPNPTSSKVFFDNTSAKFNELTIQNYLGQVVNKVNFIEFQANQEIDLSNFSTGVYILNFKSEKLNKSIKIVKQ